VNDLYIDTYNAYHRDAVFKRLRVDHMVAGQSRLSWELAPWFCDEQPWEFLPQISDTGVDTSVWYDLSGWLPNWFTIVIGPVLTGGRNLTTHFRVLLRTPSGQYTSPIQGVFGTLPSRGWVRARVIVRKERLRYRTVNVVRGWLLKRQRVGTTPDPTDRRTSVTDFLTGEITKTVDPATVGTEFFGGFYAPVPYDLDAEPSGLYEQRDEVQERGMIDDDSLTRQARIIHDPPVAHWDAFIADQSDLRFYFHRVKHVAEIASVPLVSQAELRLAPFTDVIYTVEVPLSREDYRDQCAPQPTPYAMAGRAAVAADEAQGHDGVRAPTGAAR
jgi:hypothetical protein